MKNFFFISIVFIGVVRSASDLGPWDSEYRALSYSLKKRKKVAYVKKHTISKQSMQNLVDDFLFIEKYYDLHGKRLSIRNMNWIRNAMRNAQKDDEQFENSLLNKSSDELSDISSMV